jgi:Uma2 family endonuclease
MNTFGALAPEGAAPVRFTVDQFLRMIEMGLFPDEHVELVHGEIIQLSPAHSPHARAHALVLHRLTQIYEADRLLIDCFIRLDDLSLRASDIAVLHQGITPGDTLKPGEVLLGVEIAHSSIDRDLGEKMDHYRAAGIQNYLVIDLNAERLILMTQPQDKGFNQKTEASFSEGLALPGGAGPLMLS